MCIRDRHGIGIAKKKWFEDALNQEAIDLHKRLKDVLDPKSVLNPGKFL